MSLYTDGIPDAREGVLLALVSIAIAALGGLGLNMLCGRPAAKIAVHPPAKLSAPAREKETDTEAKRWQSAQAAHRKGLCVWIPPGNVGWTTQDWPPVHNPKPLENVP